MDSNHRARQAYLQLAPFSCFPWQVARTVAGCHRFKAFTRGMPFPLASYIKLTMMRKL